MRLIDADALCEEFRMRQKAALNWKEGATLANNEESIIRADATLAFLTEVKLTIDKAPTVDPDVNCSHCDYFTFSRRFIKNVANFMADYKIETVEDLMTELNRINEWLGGKKNE